MTVIKSICMLLPALIAGVAGAQDFPVKPVRLYTAAPGSGNDFAARLFAPGMSASMGQALVVDNRGLTAIDLTLKASPDGYSLLFYGTVLWLAPFLRSNVAYDPIRDFAPVVWATDSPNILVVHPSLPVKTVGDLIALAKARPGQINYGSGSIGSTSHLAAELLRSMARIDIVRISYKGGASSLNDVISGQVQMTIPSASSVLPLVKSGRLRALGVASAKPSALVPDLPTVASAGLPGYESSSILGIFAPAGTPVNIIHRLNEEFGRALNKPEVKSKLFGAGIEVVGGTPDKLGSTIKSEMTRLGKIITDAGIRE